MVRLSSTIMMITSSGWTEQGISNPKVLMGNVACCDNTDTKRE